MDENKNRARTGVLLLHGFGGAPFEMRSLEAACRDAGMDTELPVLPGHCETVEAWNRTGWTDWLDLSVERFLALKARTEKVVVVGNSMGGSLALDLARRHEPAGVVAMGTPVFLWRLCPPEASDWRLPLLPLLRWVRPVWPTAPRDPASMEVMPWEGFDGAMALHALASFMAGIRALRRGLSQVRCPLLVLHAPDDRTTAPGNAFEIMRGVSSADRTMHLLPIEEQVSSHHVLCTHVETRERVQRLVLDFVERVTGEGGGGVDSGE